MADKKLFDMSGTEVMSTGVLKTSRLPGCYASNSGGEVVEVNQLFNVTDALDAMGGNPANQKILCYDYDNSDVRYLTPQTIEKLSGKIVGITKDISNGEYFYTSPSTPISFGKSPFTIIFQLKLPFAINGNIYSNQHIFSYGSYQVGGAKELGACSLYQIGASNMFRYEEVKVSGNPGTVTNVITTIEIPDGIHTIMISRDVFGNKSSIWIDGNPCTPSSIERVSGDILSIASSSNSCMFYYSKYIPISFSRIAILNFAFDPLKDKKLAMDIYNNGRFDKYNFPVSINHNKCGNLDTLTVNNVFYNWILYPNYDNPDKAPRIRGTAGGESGATILTSVNSTITRETTIYEMESIPSCTKITCTGGVTTSVRAKFSKTTQMQPDGKRVTFHCRIRGNNNTVATTAYVGLLSKKYGGVYSNSVPLNSNTWYDCNVTVDDWDLSTTGAPHIVICTNNVDSTESFYVSEMYLNVDRIPYDYNTPVILPSKLKALLSNVQFISSYVVGLVASNSNTLDMFDPEPSYGTGALSNLKRILEYNYSIVTDSMASVAPPQFNIPIGWKITNIVAMSVGPHSIEFQVGTGANTSDIATKQFCAGNGIPLVFTLASDLSGNFGNVYAGFTQLYLNSFTVKRGSDVDATGVASLYVKIEIERIF